MKEVALKISESSFNNHHNLNHNNASLSNSPDSMDKSLCKFPILTADRTLTSSA